MRKYLKFYIDGAWVAPAESKRLRVENPATEEVAGGIALGAAADVDRAVKAARKAFASWSQASREARLGVLQRDPSSISSARETWRRPSPKRWARRARSPTAFR